MTDLPQPDSPTMRHRLTGIDSERHAFDGPHDPVERAEMGLQVFDLEQAGRSCGGQQYHRFGDARVERVAQPVA